MPLTVLLPLVVFGIAGIAILLHILGYSRGLRFETEDDARTAWFRQFPDDTVNRVDLGATGNCAIVETSRGAGLVWAMGADSTCRILDGGQADVTQTGLVLRFPDFNAPRVRLALPQPQAQDWADRINKDAP